MINYQYRLLIVIVMVKDYGKLVALKRWINYQ